MKTVAVGLLALVCLTGMVLGQYYNYGYGVDSGANDGIGACKKDLLLLCYLAREFSCSLIY